MQKPAPILVLHLFSPLRERLLDLLTGLNEEEWSRPTAAPLWNVRDVAAHLLGDDIGALSRLRDAYQPGPPIHSHEELVVLVDGLNDQWVRASRRMSGRVLCDLLAFTGPQVESYFASLNPFGMSGPVTWAGPDPAPMWLDLAREYTERWHHQQQIRDATGREALYDPRFFGPVLDAFVRAWPHGFRDVAAPEGTVIAVEISGAAGGQWFLRRGPAAWELLIEADETPAVKVALPQDAAWRLFTKGMAGDAARRAAVIEGDVALAARIFETIAIIG